MKSLHEYTTPVTDKSRMSIDLGGIARADRGGEWVPFEDMESMERKLAACRQFIFETAKTSSSSRIRREASQVFQLTEP